MVGLFTVTTGKGFTVTVAVDDEEHEPVVPTIVYVVVEVGLATTEVPVPEDKVADGVQVYVVAPDAFKVIF